MAIPQISICRINNLNVAKTCLRLRETQNTYIMLYAMLYMRPPVHGLIGHASEVTLGKCHFKE